MIKRHSYVPLCAYQINLYVTSDSRDKAEYLPDTFGISLYLIVLIAQCLYTVAVGHVERN